MITWLSIILCDLNRYLLPTCLVFKHTGRKVWHNQWHRFLHTRLQKTSMEVLEWRISSFKSWPKQTVFIDRIDIWVSDSCLRFHEICPQGRYTFFFGQTTIKFQSDSVTHMFEFKETKVAKKICQDDTFKSNAHIQATVQAVAKMNALIVSIKESLRERK